MTTLQHFQLPVKNSWGCHTNLKYLVPSVTIWQFNACEHYTILTAQYWFACEHVDKSIRNCTGIHDTLIRTQKHVNITKTFVADNIVPITCYQAVDNRAGLCKLLPSMDIKLQVMTMLVAISPKRKEQWSISYTCLQLAQTDHHCAKNIIANGILPP